MNVLPQRDKVLDSDTLISQYISNIEFWVKKAQLLTETSEVKDTEKITGEVKALNAFLKARLFKRLVDIKNDSEELKQDYLRCLEPYYTQQGIARFVTRYFDFDRGKDNELVHRKKEKFEKESIILVDLYKIKKTIETIDTLLKSAASDVSFQSRFDQKDQLEFLKTLKEIFKLFFIRLVKKEYQKELFTSFSEQKLDPKNIVERSTKDTSYLRPESIENTEHRDKFITVLFSTLIRTKVSDQLKDLKFNYLNFEILKQEFLTDWMLQKLKGNKEKYQILSNYKIGDKTVTDIIQGNPAKEAEILHAMPIEAFNDLAEQINLTVKDEDKVPIATLSNAHGVLAKIQTKVERFKQVLTSPKKAKSQKSQPPNSNSAVSKLVETVKNSVEVREESTKAIEKFMDQARNGDIQESAITGFIEEMSGKSSPDAISAIASLKQSHHTYAHCVDVSGIFTKVYTHVVESKNKSSVFKHPNEAPFIGFMHDFGMARVPKNILDSTDRFEEDSEEIKQIRLHPQHGVELFQQMGLPDYFHNLLLYHHVKMSVDITSSYPALPDYNDVIWETRLLSIVDVYQALVGKRAYKTSWSPPAAIRYLDNLSGTEYDPDMWEAFKEIMGLYPVGSLLKLNDNSLAFVVNVPLTNQDKPEIVVIQDATGKKVENHDIIDLAKTDNLSIQDDLDAQEVFGDKALDLFTSINIS